MSNLGIQDYGWCDGFGISRQQLCSLIGTGYLMAKAQKEKRSTNPKDWYISVFCTRISVTLVASILSTNDTAINNFIQWILLFIIIYLYRYLHLVINRYLWEYLFTFLYNRNKYSFMYASYYILDVYSVYFLYVQNNITTRYSSYLRIWLKKELKSVK